MRAQRANGYCEWLRRVAALIVTLLGVGCSANYDEAPRRWVDRPGAIDPAALGTEERRSSEELDSLDDPGVTFDLLSDAGMHPVNPGSSGVCAVSFDVGDCSKSMNVYWHNPATGVCEFKVGCPGNENHFTSISECVEVCGGSAPAPCEFAEQRYHPGQLVETECGGCECDPAGSGQLRCPRQGDASPCDPLGAHQTEPG
jgi:hypothetical protein